MSQTDDTQARPRTAPQRRSQRWAVTAIDFYQRAASGRPSPCRFYPSCSTYARESYDLYGARRGSWLTLRRLLRCRPFGPSGYDPVPEPVDRSASTTSSAPMSPVAVGDRPSVAVGDTAAVQKDC